YAINKIGGVRRNINDDDLPQIEKVLNIVEEKTTLFTKAILDDPVLKARLENVGILTREQAIAYSVVGPTARGSGVAIDVRKDDPYAAYDLVPWDIIVFDEGDILAKAKVRLLECFESIRIIRGCIKKMKKGEIQVPVDEIPRGEGIGHHEAPRGEVFHYVRSDGGKSPARHKIRAPSYNNIPSNEIAVLDYSIADAALVLAAVDPCYCCTERTTIVQDGKVIGYGKDLLNKSWEKTAKLKEKYKR
ncbi:MAG TPA: NADH:ubiquinone oxidoreductase, partial [bacterium (Candidatus Stahlbacteria)]|nr:NADH:ubiquinone oxidoreductase [Candidatus Stahlbacteria bacterium]